MTMKILPFSNLSKRQRESTPLLFALHLTGTVQAAFRCEKISCLWTRNDSIYFSIPDTDCWPKKRDANKYPGPFPVICHPPCGPWGKLKHLSRENYHHGVRAMELIHQFGGVVEQPEGSALFKIYGRGGRITKTNQADFGHLCLKPTLLYWILP